MLTHTCTQLFFNSRVWISDALPLALVIVHGIVYTIKSLWSRIHTYFPCFFRRSLKKKKKKRLLFAHAVDALSVPRKTLLFARNHFFLLRYAFPSEWSSSKSDGRVARGRYRCTWMRRAGSRITLYDEVSFFAASTSLACISVACAIHVCA